MIRQKPTVFNCFSPPVMIATMVIEVALALYTIWRYKLNVLGRLIVITLLALATFQLAEYSVCTGPAAHAVPWSRLGFIAITTLPPLGIHLLHVLAGNPRRRLVAASYLTMLGFIVFFLFNSAAFDSHQCTGNYVIFHLAPRSGGLYYAYYYGWLGIALGLGFRWVKQLVAAGKKARSRLETVQALMAGFLVFLVPTTVVNTIKPSTISGLPSVMCGFAVLFALILGFYIAPRAADKRK